MHIPHTTSSHTPEAGPPARAAQGLALTWPLPACCSTPLGAVEWFFKLCSRPGAALAGALVLWARLVFFFITWPLRGWCAPRWIRQRSWGRLLASSAVRLGAEWLLLRHVVWVCVLALWHDCCWAASGGWRLLTRGLCSWRVFMDACVDRCVVVVRAWRARGFGFRVWGAAQVRVAPVQQEGASSTGGIVFGCPPGSRVTTKT